MAVNTQSIKLASQVLRSLSYTSVTESYTAVGSGLTHPANIFAIQNQTDVDVFWSWNGTEPNGFLAANGGHIILDVTTNKKWDQGMFIGLGKVTYVAALPGQSSPTKGAVYVTAFHNELIS